MAIDRFYPLGGGAELQALQLSRQLQLEGVKVMAVTRRVDADMPPVEIVDGLPIYRVRPSGLRTHLITALEFFTFALALWRHRSEYDVIHTHDARTVYLAAVLIHWLTRKPLVAKVPTLGDLSRAEFSRTRRSTYSEIVRRLLMPRFVWNFLLRRASAWIAISDDIADELEDCGLEELTWRIPNAVDAKRFRPATAAEKTGLRRRLHLPLDKTILISHGRISSQKRLDVLIHAVARLLDEFPNLILVLPGDFHREDMGIELLLRDEIHAFGLDNVVLLPGRTERPEDYLRAADAYALSSAFEGMPNALLEALACGLPSVSTAVSGATDILGGGNSGLLVPVDDAVALAAALKRVLGDAPFAAKLAAHGVKLVRERYSWEQVTRRYLRLYYGLLGLVSDPLEYGSDPEAPYKFRTKD
jgi:glycosyltransferase involved in cell wall biosynthesis